MLCLGYAMVGLGLLQHIAFTYVKQVPLLILQMLGWACRANFGGSVALATPRTSEFVLCTWNASCFFLCTTVCGNVELVNAGELVTRPMLTRHHRLEMLPALYPYTSGGSLLE